MNFESPERNALIAQLERDLNEAYDIIIEMGEVPGERCGDCGAFGLEADREHRDGCRVPKAKAARGKA